MDTQAIPLRVTAARLLRSVGILGASEYGRRAKLISGALVALLCASTGLNVVNSYVGRNFMTAIANRNSPEFVWQAVLYVGVFAALTVVAVISRFQEESLAVLWRESITRGALGLYFADGAFYRLEATGKLGNADQRIAEDAKNFTVATLSFVLLALGGAFTIIAFSDVLWTISRLLFLVAVLYAVLGSSITFFLGRPLIRLNYDQFDREASFRASLIHVRENAEAILVSRTEEKHEKRLRNQFESLVSNFRQITVVNRNVGFFSTGYNWLIQIIPALIIAPSFIRGEVEFGVITQAAMAFSTLVAAFSLIVTQFQALSTYAAVVARLNALIEAIERSRIATGREIEIVENGRLAFEGLTLLSSANGAVLLENLTATIPAGVLTLVGGPNDAACAALFRAIAGVGIPGSGRIARPAGKNVQFVAQRAYLPPCALRELLADDAKRERPGDGELLALLRELGLDPIVAKAGGLDKEQDWSALLTLPEQHLLAFARIFSTRPLFALLDRAETSLDAERFRRVLGLFSARGIACVCFGEADGARDLFDAVLECREDGGWSWTRKGDPVRLIP